MLFEFCQMTPLPIAKQSILHSHLTTHLSLNYEISKNLVFIKDETLITVFMSSSEHREEKS